MKTFKLKITSAGELDEQMTHSLNLQSTMIVLLILPSYLAPIAIQLGCLA